MNARPGDLILVKSRGLFYAAARRFFGNAYDHVAIVTRDGGTLNIDKPATRMLPLDRLLRPSLEPLVLRPRFATDDARDRFLSDLEQLSGAPYDVARTLWLIERLLERKLTGRARMLSPLGFDRKRWICTDAVLLSLERNVAGFDDLRSLPLDFVKLGSATTNDLLELQRLRPQLIERVST